MTVDEAMKVRKFSIDWITKVVAKRSDYRKRLVDVIVDLIPDDIHEYDPWDILDIIDWDHGKYYCGFGDRLKELIEWDDGYYFDLSQKARDDIVCAIRIGVDLYIEQSGGVIGYTVGDLRKVFDGEIPLEILKNFKNPEQILNANDDEPIWL